MKLINKHNRLELVVEDDLMNRLGKLGVKHYPHEFGGFLIGSYAADFGTVFINDLSVAEKIQRLILRF